MILFSDRRNIELSFLKWCEETHHSNCPISLIAWLLTSKEGKAWVVKMYSELIENLLKEQ